MVDRLSLLNLSEWAEAPVKRFSPLPAAVVLAPGGTLVLTAAGSTPIGNGNLPTAADLGDSPYYHLMVSSFDAGGVGVGTPVVTVDVDGVQRLAPSMLTADEFTDAYPPGVIYFRIPASATTVTIENQSGAVSATLVYSYAVPQIPTNTNSERLSLVSQQEWDLAPWGYLDTEPAGTNDFDNAIAIAAGGSYNLVLPTATQLAGAPWYWLLISILGQPADDTEGAYILYNGSTVPGDKVQVVPTLGGVSTIWPDPPLFTASNSLNVTTFPFPRLSADGTTQITVQNVSAAAVYGLRYRFIVPVATFNDFTS